MTRFDGKSIKTEELAVIAGWGHGGDGKPVMPGRGRITERPTYATEELDELEAAAKAAGVALEDIVQQLGPPIDVWLNDVAYWRAVPKVVWDFSIGGYQVFKKWLSYREQAVLGRPLTLAEAHEATSIVRRLAAIVLLQKKLDENYVAVRDAPYAWPASASE